MVRGLYISGLGMTTQMKMMDVLSNNIANVNTTAYKKDISVTRTFSEELTRRLDDPATKEGTWSWYIHDMPVGRWSNGLYVDDVYTDFSIGSFQMTNGPLDLAISGNGFFAVELPDGTEMYTRDGSFTLGSDGTLLTTEGNKVLGRDGAVNIHNGNITIDYFGRIFSGSEYVDTLKMVDFDDYHTLRKRGDNLYAVTENSNQIAFNARTYQGYLEGSNVSAVREMVDLINISRLYEANQRMITIHDSTLGKAVSEIARK